MALDFDILGKGVYSPQEVARYIGGSPQEVLRWTRGSGPNDPLWNAYYQEMDDTTELSFSDLVELRVVKSLRNAGLSLQAIRFAIDFSREKFDLYRPLSSVGFKTDGKEILMDAIEHDGELVSLSKKRPGQKVFSEIVKQSLSDLDYEEGRPIRWRPQFFRSVVLDPERLFGEAILDEFGVSTSTIAKDFENFSDVKYIADIYEIPVQRIRDALKFEETLDNKQMN